MQLHQKNRSIWSCFHQRYLQADLTYEVTQERGYWVTRLRSVKFLESRPVPSARLEPEKIQEKVIPFPQPGVWERSLTRRQMSEERISTVA